VVVVSLSDIFKGPDLRTILPQLLYNFKVNWDGTCTTSFTSICLRIV
jgi:hypothetical protein